MLFRRARDRTKRRRRSHGKSKAYETSYIRGVPLEIEMLLENDIIETSKLSWACGVVMTKKKLQQLKFCCNFRYLNAVTIQDAFPIPRIDESLWKLSDAKFFFTALDLGSAFWQLPSRKLVREKTGFASELGLYLWKKMPSGL